jgi:hypothetical protein
LIAILAYFGSSGHKESLKPQLAYEQAMKDFANQEYEKVVAELEHSELPEAYDLIEKALFRLDSIVVQQKLDSLGKEQPNIEDVNIAMRLASRESYRTTIQSIRPSNGKPICVLLDSLNKYQQEYNTRIDTIEREMVWADKEIKQREGIIAVCKEMGYKRLNFSITRRFDTDASSGKGLYETVCLTTYEKSVLVANEGDIPSNVYSRMNVRLLVKDRGEQPVVVQNSYGSTSQQYLKTYEAISSDDLLLGNADPDKAKSQLKLLYLFKKKFGPSTEKEKLVEKRKFNDKVNRLILTPLRKLI